MDETSMFCRMESRIMYRDNAGPWDVDMGNLAPRLSFGCWCTSLHVGHHAQLCIYVTW